MAKTGTLSGRFGELTGREERAWHDYHRMQSQITGKIARDLTRQTGLSEADYAILTALADVPGGKSRALALRTDLQWEKSRLSHQLSRMERRGLVTRTECDEDSRSSVFELTDEGHAAVAHACGEHARLVRAYMLDALTPGQLDALTEISNTVLAHLDEAR